MKIRTTEREHPFTVELFKKLNLFSLQGLTLSGAQAFTAAIEAIQYEPDELVVLDGVFPIIEVKAKYYLAKALQIPLYFIIFQNGIFSIYEISVEESFHSELRHSFTDEAEFVSWWSELKGLKQPKKLMEAADRVKDSIFDSILAKNNMAWGGNIDGYMFKNKKFACIIENIYTQKNPLNSPKADPAVYFKLRGPNYNTWYPTVKLANKLNIPLFLFTIEGNSEAEKIGFSVIDYLSNDGIFYIDDKTPNNNIIEGLEQIEKIIGENLNNKAPQIK